MTKRIPLLFVVGVLIYGLCAPLASAQPTQVAPETFPFLGEVTTKNVNVRAGQSTNFERIYRLQKGDEVIVTDKSFSWYKVKLPGDATSFIYKEYVKLSSPNEGLIIADRVNVRAGPGTQYTILSQLRHGETVKIIKTTEDWYKIIPPPKAVGWVLDKFIAFKSEDTTSGESLVDLLESPAEPLLPIDEKLLAPVKRGLDPEPVPTVLALIGKIRKTAAARQVADIRYQLVVDNQYVYYLKGANAILDDFLQFQVVVEGILQPKPHPVDQNPILDVARIELLL